MTNNGERLRTRSPAKPFPIFLPIMNQLSIIRCFTVAFGILVLSSFTGCTHQFGNRSLNDVGKYMALRQGVSTKHDVYASFGQPHDVQYSPAPPSPSFWRYYHLTTTQSGWGFVPYLGVLVGGSHDDLTKANFHFNASNRFTRVETSKDASFTNNWVGIARGLSRIANDTQTDRVKAEMARIGKPFDKKTARSVKDLR